MTMEKFAQLVGNLGMPDVEGSKEYFDSVVDDETLEYLDAGFKKLQVTISNLKRSNFKIINLQFPSLF